MAPTPFPRIPCGAVPPGFAVVAACWAVQQLHELPQPWLARALIASGAAVWLLLVLGPWPRRARGGAGRVLAWIPFASAAAMAFGWAVGVAHSRLSERLDPALEGVELHVVGVVDEMPQAFDRGVRFRFRIERCVEGAAGCPGPVAVRLGWYRAMGRGPQAAPPELHPGERWQLAIRLKRPHATLNPGLFDPELRALEDGIAGTGAVRDGRSNAGVNRRIDAFVATPRTVIEFARDRIRAAMLAAVSGQSEAGRGVVVALAVGDQAAIPGPWWEVFNRTGVGHLMSISGLHITMLAALGGRVAGGLWSSRRLAAAMRRRPPPAWIPTPYVRWAAGLGTGFGYAALAGWGIPAQRTCWMLAAAGLALLTGRARSPISVLSTAAAVVCVLDPWSPMAAGFWLSFAAVAAIIWFGSQRAASSGPEEGAGWRTRITGTLQEALRSQVAATLSLLPLGVVFFSSVSLVGPLANAVAIPLVSAVVTPLALAGAAIALVWTSAAVPPLALGSWLSDWLLAMLKWMEFGGAGAISVGRPSAAALLLGAAGCAVLLAPFRLPGRRLAVLALCPLLLAPEDRPTGAEIRLTALDIGQGTAVLVETEQGRLLYDTGPELGGDNDAGARSIVPYLRARGIERLEAMIVSHQDSDHSGGALSVLRNLSIDWVASSLADDHPIVAASKRHYPCARGAGWRWGEVAFDWLHPGDDDPVWRRSPTNSRSCVLRIRSPAGAILLVGDIEAAQEKHLLVRLPAEELRAAVLLAPHHGSKTSSTAEFLDTVRPAFAVFQVGYRNRYRHPNPAVLERYRSRGIGVLRSDAHAAIGIRMRVAAAPEIRLHRLEDRKYWRIRLPAEEDVGSGRSDDEDDPGAP